MSTLWNFTLPTSQSDTESTSSEGDSSSEEDVVREMLEPVFLTTAQQRTRVTMFGVTQTEYTQTAVTHPVLYIAVYSTDDATSEIDDYHWTFIVGPSREEADSEGTLYNMEPRQVPGYSRQHGGDWWWLYNQPTVPLRGQCDLLARLMIAEVADMNMLQAIMLRWGTMISMRDHVEWMSVMWVKNVLMSLDEEEGCLGRRMESFRGVEAEGRWLAGTEKEKRKRFCLLDTRVSTRTLFEREKATALSSTATVDIAIKYPVLYIAVYRNDRPPRENDEFHWTFLIGPSTETAESEGVRCALELHLDSNGRPTWDYNQTIVPLRGEDDLLARMLIAEVVDLGPLGKVLRDHDATPTIERTESMAGVSEWNSLAWVREKLGTLEKRPECFAYKCHHFGMFERVGRELAGGSKQQRKNGVTPLGVEVRTLCLVNGWGKPDDDETKVDIQFDLARGESTTISRAIQIVTGVLGAAALAMPRRVAEREQRELKGKQEREARAKHGGNEDATSLAEPTKLQRVNEEDEEDTDEEDTGEEDTDEDGEVRVKTITTITFAEPNKPKNAPGGKQVAKEDETESEDEDQTESKDEDQTESEDEDKTESEDEEDDDEDDDNEAANKANGSAEEDTGKERMNARPEGIRGTSTHIAESNKPGGAPGRERVAEEDEEDEDETESEEDDDDDGDEEQDDGDDGDGDDEDETTDEDDDDEGDDEDDDEEEEEDGVAEKYSRVQTTVGNISTITLSR